MSELSLLVAVDFEETSERAFGAALVLGAKLGASLDLVHVSPPPPPAADEKEWLRSEREKLAALCDRASRVGVSARTHVWLDAPVPGLLESIEALKPYLVVMGSHGRSGVGRALLGSVAESVARKSIAPVVIVPSLEHAAVSQPEAETSSDGGDLVPA